ncbi:hypothetical protein KY290_007798 [Solanum tuberosum]|uniref:Uncharacterized protein n=1 Tax=Solanum tuberosum TaxID=4113 RepID=A0ABQ7W9C2_SOLTU|nr:hypothetical protein KY290_007798 [Solanum tuberosum]
MHAPSEAHWRAIKRLIRYLKSTTNYGIRITPRSSLDLSVFSYADWVGNLSYADWAENLSDRSSTTVNETIWVKDLLKELHVKILTPPTIFCDNLGVTYLCENNNLHIVVYFRYVRQ